MEPEKLIAALLVVCAVGLVALGICVGIHGMLDVGPWVYDSHNIKGLTYTIYDNGDMSFVYTPTGHETAFDVTTFRERGRYGSELQDIYHIDNPRTIVRVDTNPAVPNARQLYTVIMSTPEGSTQISIWNHHN